MKLNLTRPLVFFDIESTGLNITADKIVEISYIKVNPNGTEESKTIRVNPEMHIPDQSSEIHHIYDDDVKDCPTFKMIAKELATTFEVTLQGLTATVSISPCLMRSSIGLAWILTSPAVNSLMFRPFSIKWSSEI